MARCSRRTGPAITTFLGATLLVSASDLWTKQAVCDALNVVTAEMQDGRPRVISQDVYPVIRDWFELEANYNSPTRPFIPADFTVDGVTYPNVGVRFRGASSYYGLGPANAQQPPVETG